MDFYESDEFTVKSVSRCKKYQLFFMNQKCDIEINNCYGFNESFENGCKPVQIQGSPELKFHIEVNRVEHTFNQRRFLAMNLKIFLRNQMIESVKNLEERM